MIDDSQASCCSVDVRLIDSFTGIKDSQISSDGPKINNHRGTTAVLATRLNGPPVENHAGTSEEGELKCAGVFDEEYRFLAESCP